MRGDFKTSDINMRQQAYGIPADMLTFFFKEKYKQCCNFH